MEKPKELTEEMEKELRVEAESLEGTLGWGVPYTEGVTPAVEAYFWEELVYRELGLDSCETCGYWDQSDTFYYGNCEDCVENEDED